MRLIGERINVHGSIGDAGPPPSGIVIVPYEPGAQWWRLIRYFTVVGRWEAGSQHLEMCQLGEWKPVPAKRTSLALAFPRSAGRIPRPILKRSDDEEMSEGYVESVDVPGVWALPVMTGSFVYSPGPSGRRGELYLVWRQFNPAERGREADEEGTLRVSCAELLREKGNENKFLLDMRAHRQGGSFANGPKTTPWEVAVSLLWTVDHLVLVDEKIELADQGGETSSPRVRTKGVDLERRIFSFNWRQAEEEVARQMARGAQRSEVLRPEAGTERPGASQTHEDETHEDEAGTDLLDGEVEEASRLLERAKVSAKEAADLKKLKELPGARGKSVKGQSAGESSKPDPPRIQICRYAGMKCEGCKGGFRLGERIEAGFRSLVHLNPRCRVLAGAKFNEVALEERTARAKEKIKGSSLRNEILQARLDEKMGETRLQGVRRCIDGRCEETNEQRLMCLRGCGRGAHLMSCLQTSSYYQAAGRLICYVCRLEEILGENQSGKAGRSLVDNVTRSMIGELTTGAISTAAGRSQFATLERKWVSSMLGPDGGSAAEIKLPRYNVESFMAFLWWLITDADRARSFGTVVRAGGAVMTMLELEDWTKTARVKAVIKEIKKMCNVEAEPCTQTTRRIVGIMLGDTLKEVCSNKGIIDKRLLSRTEALMVLELCGGLRVGEATAGGDMHGLLANDLCFQRPRNLQSDDLGETVEISLKDSKTGPGRRLAFVGVSRTSKIPNAGILRRWLKVAGVDMCPGQMEGGFVIERPDYWVVRVSLVAASNPEVEKFLRMLAETQCEAVAAHAKSSQSYVKQRMKAKTIGEEMKYVNIAGGRKAGPEVQSALRWAEKIGWARRATVVPGPLIRATHGDSLSHMPLATGSTYTHLVKAMELAYEKSSQMETPDPELELQGLKEPHFGNHSLRRHGDRVARETKELTKVTKETIDYFFGWLLVEMMKDMQLHYAGLDMPGRRELAKVTMYM